MFYGKGLCEWVGSRFSPGRWILLYKESGILRIMETDTDKGKREGDWKGGARRLSRTWLSHEWIRVGGRQKNDTQVSSVTDNRINTDALVWTKIHFILIHIYLYNINYIYYFYLSTYIHIKYYLWWAYLGGTAPSLALWWAYLGGTTPSLALWWAYLGGTTPSLALWWAYLGGTAPSLALWWAYIGGTKPSLALRWAYLGGTKPSLALWWAYLVGTAPCLALWWAYLGVWIHCRPGLFLQHLQVHGNTLDLWYEEANMYRGDRG